MIGTWYLTRRLVRYRQYTCEVKNPRPPERWLAWWCSKRLMRAFPGPRGKRQPPQGRAGQKAVARALPVIVDRITPPRQPMPRLWRVAIRPTPFGWEIEFNRPRTVEKFNVSPTDWAKVLDVFEVRFSTSGKRIVADVRMRNPFNDPLPPQQNPLRPGARPSWQKGYLIGRNVEGAKLLYRPDIDHNALIAGTMGSGKTTLADLLIGQMVLDPDMDVALVDPQGGSQLGHWGPWTWAFGDAPESALSALWRVYHRGESNLKQMADAAGIQKVWPGRRITLFVDEANTATKWGDKIDGQPAAQWLVTRIMERHRAAGTQVILVSQRPQHESIGTTVRAHCQTRYVFTMSSAADGAMALIDEAKGDVPFDASELAPKSGQMIVRTVAAGSAGRAIGLAQTWYTSNALLLATISSLPLVSERAEPWAPPAGPEAAATRTGRPLPPPVPVRAATVAASLPEEAAGGPFDDRAVAAVAVAVADAQAQVADLPTGETLKARREAVGVTQVQLAEVAGCTDKTVRNAEGGKASAATVRRLLDALEAIESAA